MIKCQVCHQEFKRITPQHLQRHDLSIVDYRSQFPDAELTDESIKPKGEKNPFYGRKHSLEFKLKESKRVKGTHLSDETKAKVSRGLKDAWNKPESVFNDDYRKRLQISIAKSWQDSSEVDRSKRFEKVRQTNYESGRWTKPENKEAYVAYRDEVRKLSELSFQKYFYVIVNAKLRGAEFHLDHKLSIAEGFKSGVSPEVLASHHNLCILPKKSNLEKSTSCSITIEELQALIKEDNERSSGTFTSST